MFFGKASDCFGKAVDQDPANESYKRAKEMSAKVRWKECVCALGGGGDIC